MILAAQSDFFEGLFTFPSDSGDKDTEFNITTPNIHPYLTEENFKLVLDTFYEIEPDFDEDKALEMAAKIRLMRQKKKNRKKKRR